MNEMEILGWCLAVVVILVIAWFMPTSSSSAASRVTDENTEVQWYSTEDPLYCHDLNCMVTKVVDEGSGYSAYKYLNPKVRGRPLFELVELSYTEKYSYLSNSGEITIKHLESGEVEHINLYDSDIPTFKLENFLYTCVQFHIEIPRVGVYSKESFERSVKNLMKLINMYTPEFIRQLRDEEEKQRIQDLYASVKRIGDKKCTIQDVKDQIGVYKRKTTYKPVELVGQKESNVTNNYNYSSTCSEVDKLRSGRHRSTPFSSSSYDSTVSDTATILTTASVLSSYGSFSSSSDSGSM